MICQHCDEDASVHLTQSSGEGRREIHLCAACARKAGLSAAGKPTPLGVDAMVETMVAANVGTLAGTLADLACPVCGIKYMEYRSTGRLGCPNDYSVFTQGLLPLLSRSQQATRHVGKAVKHHSVDPLARLRLRAQLRDAVSREDYEAAARLRDQLRLKDLDE